MWVSWASGSETDQALNWGETSGSLGSTAVANTTSYSGFGGYTSPFLHHALIGGLKTATKYFYTVGSADECGVSSEMSFTSNPGPGAPFVFGLLGDPGQTANSADTFKHIQAGPVGAVMLVGDLSYAGASRRRLGRSARTRLHAGPAAHTRATDTGVRGAIRFACFCRRCASGG